MQDPADRPTAAELLNDRWLVASQSTLRMSWKRSAGLARKGLKPRDAHETLSSVMERMLQSHASGTARSAGGDDGGAAQLGSRGYVSNLPPIPGSARGTRETRDTRESGLEVARQPSAGAGIGHGEASELRPSDVHLRLVRSDVPPPCRHLLVNLVQLQEA
jgi:hypothetical protein